MSNNIYCFDTRSASTEFLLLINTFIHHLNVIALSSQSYLKWIKRLINGVSRCREGKEMMQEDGDEAMEMEYGNVDVNLEGGTPPSPNYEEKGGVQE